MASTIRRGDLVEFTDGPHYDYPPAESDPDQPQFGVAVEDEIEHGYPLKVEMASGRTRDVRHIHASGWIGWMPDDLEPVWERIQSELEAERYARYGERDDEFTY